MYSLHYRKKQIYCRNGEFLSKYLDLEISYQISCISNELEMIDSICEETDNTFNLTATDTSRAQGARYPPPA